MERLRTHTYLCQQQYHAYVIMALSPLQYGTYSHDRSYKPRNGHLLSVQTELTKIKICQCSNICMYAYAYAPTTLVPVIYLTWTQILSTREPITCHPKKTGLVMQLQNNWHQMWFVIRPSICNLQNLVYRSFGLLLEVSYWVNCELFYGLLSQSNTVANLKSHTYG